MRRIRRGEYTIATIGMLGVDPLTGRSYEECNAEWRAELDKVSAVMETMRWWHVRSQIWVRWRLFVLHERFGM